ncbi:4Fe-4S single cluster domain-containing protein [Sorangium sp. So ce128]|uniref:4Fe-4S single cluster domain-containing protein n=1 Tax=Sorangium sp. So ce128 TaxID=3133281 RepID=UPI003F63E643
MAARSAIYGPGERFVLWLQGCAIRCPGCWNQDLWTFEERSLWEPATLAERVLEEPGLEGVTLLGGEPLHQAEALVPFLDIIRAASLSVMLYTGFELEELDHHRYQPVLERTDLLVLGRYRAEERELSLLWRGSRNQRVIPLGERYQGLMFEEANQMEVVVRSDGRVGLRGFPGEWVWAVL